MTIENEQIDVAIIGAGPIGIACGVEARRAGLSAILFEKGCLTNSIYHFPTNLVFFSTADLLEIGDIPFITCGPKPTRSEILQYYKRVAQHYDLDVHLFEKVERVSPENGAFAIHTNRRSEPYRARHVVLSIGFYDHPNYLNVPGEDLPKVSHYYKEAHLYYNQKVAIVGGQNSAVEAALEIYRAGAREVTLIHRRAHLGDSVKYWIRPDIENRIKEGSIRAYFNTVVKEIRPHSIVIEREAREVLELENDFVLALTGYHPDYSFLKMAGVALQPETNKPVYDPETYETNVPGVYIAGVACGGKHDINKIFIENGREHARLIMADIQKKRRKGR